MRLVMYHSQFSNDYQLLTERCNMQNDMVSQTFVDVQNTMEVF